MMFNRIILEDSVFNEDVYDKMKSVAKLKFLHIGLKVTEAVLKHLSEMTGAKTVSLKLFVIESLLINS